MELRPLPQGQKIKQWGDIPHVEEIDTEIGVMVGTEQAPKCLHRRGCASIVVILGVYRRNHDRKRGIIILLYHEIILNNDMINRSYYKSRATVNSRSGDQIV